MSQEARMKKAPALPIYTKDYDTDERVLLMNLAEEGAYNRLMRHEWREGSIPADQAALAKILRVSRVRMKKLWFRLQSCFKSHPFENGRLINPKLELVRKQQVEFLVRKSKAGKISAANRRKSHKRGQKRKKSVDVLLEQNVNTTSTPLVATEAQPSVSVAVAVAVPERMNGRPAVHSGGPPSDRVNPLVAGRREELEREALRLASEVGRLQDKDPMEVMQTAAHYQGARTSKLNPATMSDDRLANTVLDLRATLEAERAKPPPPERPR
jgi:uncharacterized protein YdaU (DUF1376 family)